MKAFKIYLLMGLSLFLVACPGTHLEEELRGESVQWNDPRILRGTYSGDYGAVNPENSQFVKLGTLTLKATPEYDTLRSYKVQGSFQMEGQEAVAFQKAAVWGGNREEYVAPQHSPPMDFPARFDGYATVGKKSYSLNFVLLEGKPTQGSLQIIEAVSPGKEVIESYSFSLTKQNP